MKIKEIFCNLDVIDKVRRNAWNLVDGLGAKRVVDYITNISNKNGALNEIKIKKNIGKRHKKNNELANAS